MGLLMRSRPVPNGTADGGAPSRARYPRVGSLPAASRIARPRMPSRRWRFLSFSSGYSRIL